MFFIETFVFILISLILISHFYIPKDGILFKISDLSHIICLVCIIHSITKLYVETILDDKNSILSFLTFIFYICLLSSSFYLLGAGTDLEKVIRYVLAIIFSIIFIYYIYYIYIGIRRILLIKKHRNIEE
ncbi:hypothetical protein [Candidatus Phytoplasma fraxini]|uniref:hypothetical protein n=1 Tax=Ash yellows phytoplasma TaxID=35780 RepID=UPI0030FED2DA